MGFASGTLSFDETSSAEQTLMTLAFSDPNAIDSILVDGTNITQATTTKFYTKIAGTNSRYLSNVDVSIAAGQSVVVQGPIAAGNQCDLKLVCGGGGGGSVAVYYWCGYENISLPDVVSGNIAVIDNVLDTTSGNTTTLDSVIDTMSGILAATSGTLATLDNVLDTVSGNLFTTDNVVDTVSGIARSSWNNVMTVSGDLAVTDNVIDTISGVIRTINNVLAVASGNVSLVDANVDEVLVQIGNIKGTFFLNSLDSLHDSVAKLNTVISRIGT